ncbi:MAG: LCCL domain-containing protein, partial [Parvibaculaceae bacterium]
ENKAGDTIWGTNPYYSNSSLCRAAVHSGAITPQGGMIVVKPVREAPFYPSVTKNGIDSASTGASSGFTVEAAGGSTKNATAMQEPQAGTAMTLDICPNNYTSFPMDGPALTCGCSAEQVKEGGTIWGTNPYYTYSSLCRAAAHAGAITSAGGQITVTPAADVPVYPGVTKNGIQSASTGRADGFRVMGEKQAAAQPAVDASGSPKQAPIAETLKATGRVQLYVNFATDQAVPLPSSTPVLMELLATLNNDPALRLELIGHTDNEGGANYNLDLSQRRAAGIYFYLVKAGIDPKRLKSSGHGLMEPIADNATAEGRALNRRVEALQMQ